MQGGELAVSLLILRVATQVVEAIEQGVVERGFTGVRPAHAFVLVCIGAGDATVVELAEDLGVSKQAASQLVEQLARHGYITREPNPRDGRSRLLCLTARGRACTRATEDAATSFAADWTQELGSDQMAALRAALQAVVVPGPLRPAW